MLNNVVVVAPPGAAWPDFNIPVLSEPNPDDGIFCQKVDGLDSVQANILSRGYGLVDGEFYSGSNIGKRNIVLHLILEAINNTVSYARRQIRAFLPPKQLVTLRLEFTDRDPVVIDGYVEAAAGDRFNNDPEMQVSVICPKPNFLSVDDAIVNGVAGSDPAPVTALYLGDVSGGLQLRLEPDDTESYSGDLIIESMVEGETPGEYFTAREMRINAMFFSTSQYFWLNSYQGQKVTQARDLVDNEATNVLMGMTEDSTWPILHPGPNLLRVRTLGDAIARPWTAYFRHQYGEV